MQTLFSKQQFPNEPDADVRNRHTAEVTKHLTSSVTVVQFMVHSRGSQEPVASQKGLTAPEGSRTGLVDSPNKVPDVPRDITQVPSCTAPAPRALIWLSPLPGATCTSGVRPSSLATSDLSVPTTYTPDAWLPDARLGILMHTCFCELWLAQKPSFAGRHCQGCSFPGSHWPV